MSDHDWMRHAACRGRDLVLFFGPDGEHRDEREVREAKAALVCGGCPVADRCLNYAVDRPEKYGFWGRMNEDQRDTERRRVLRVEAEADEKRCTGCGEVKPLPRFSKDRRRPDGRSSRCAACATKSAVDSRRRRKEAVA